LRLLRLGLLCMLLFGCTKTETTYIPNNEAPPDVSVSTLKLETYVNKCYIGLLGRKPTDAELATGVQTLRDSSLSSGGRRVMLASILDQEAFLIKTYINDGTLLLNNWDTSLFNRYLSQLSIIRQDSAYSQVYVLIDSGIVSLERLLSIPEDYINGTIDTRTMHARMVNNYAYDEVNMGGENFVRSIFDHFLLRYPTTAELAEGIKMFDGFEGVVFTKTGSSRHDFVTIFFSEQGYYEGQVRWAFKRFLYRDANTEELAYYTNIFYQSGEQKILFNELLTLNEYAGI